MKASEIPLQAGMWLRDAHDGEELILAEPIEHEEVDSGKWHVFSPYGNTKRIRVNHPEASFKVMNHPANVGPLFEACVDRWRDFFVDKTRSNVAPWRAFPRRGDAPIACEATLCGALLAALALPEKGSQ